MFVPRKTSFTSEHIPTADQTLRGLLRVPVSWQPGTPGRSSPPCPGGGVRAERAGWARLRAQSRGEAEAEGLSTHLPRLPTPARLTQVAHLARSTQKHGQRQPRKAGCWAGFAGERGSSARGPLSLSVPWLSPEPAPDEGAQGGGGAGRGVGLGSVLWAWAGRRLTPAGLPTSLCAHCPLRGRVTLWREALPTLLSFGHPTWGSPAPRGCDREAM